MNLEYILKVDYFLLSKLRYKNDDIVNIKIKPAPNVIIAVIAIKEIFNLH